MTEEIIIHRGEKINVSQIRKRLASFKNEDGTLYYSPTELEEEVKREILYEKRWIGRAKGAKFEKHQGFCLKFYLQERQLFPEAFSTKVSDDLARKIVKKLIRHFYGRKASSCPSVRFYGHKQSGALGWGMRLSHNPSIGLICHEVAHMRVSRHSKKLMRLIKKMVKYCKKKNYWEEE